MDDHNLAKNTLDQIPRPDSNAKRIIGLVKISSRIAGVGIARRGDTEHLKSIPDGSENNNLSNHESRYGLVSAFRYNEARSF